MLDERIELAEYTCFIGEGMPQSLTYLNITTGLSGVPRALKVIARPALFDLGMNAKQTKDSCWLTVLDDLYKDMVNKQNA